MGQPQKNAFDATIIPVQENGGAYSGHQLPRRANWSGHTGFTNIVQGSASYVTGSHSAKFGFRYHVNDSTFPMNFYNNTQLKYQLPERRPNQVTDVRRRELAAGTAAEHDRVVCAGSLDARAPDAAGRPPLRAPRRLLSAAADGAEHLPSDRRLFPAQDGPLNHKDLQPRFGASYDVFGTGNITAYTGGCEGRMALTSWCGKVKLACRSEVVREYHDGSLALVFRLTNGRFVVGYALGDDGDALPGRVAPRLRRRAGTP